MKRLDEILKSTGASVTSAASAGSAPVPEEPEELCPDCGGAGFVRRAVRLGHPDFGRAFPCSCTDDEGEDQRLSRLQRYSNLGALLRLTFDELTPHGRSPRPQDQERFAAALQAAREFAREPSGWLLFSGPSGCGKTHLAAAIANRSIAEGRPALFMGVPDLLDHLRAAYRPDSEIGYDELFEMVRSAPLLILDDLGVHSSTPWAEEKLFQIVNHRYQSRTPTVFTSGRDITELDPRLQTRLGDPTLAQVHRLESVSGSAAEIDALDLPLLRSMTFKSFDPQYLTADKEDQRQVREAYRHALKFAEEPRDWLVIAGQPGSGKTRLAAAIGNYRREADPAGVLFVVVPDLLDRLRSTFQPNDARAFDELFDQVRNVRLLILDDLGAQTGTPWAEEKLFQLLNYRYNASLPTVITTSQTVSEMDGRLVSRLTDPQVSSTLLMGRFDFWGKPKAPAAGRAPRGRGRR